MKIKSMSLLLVTLLASTPLLAADRSWTGLKLGIGAGGKYTTGKSKLSGGHNVGNNSDTGDIYDATGDLYSSDGENSAYIEDYYAEENFNGTANGNSDLGKAQGFATFDATYDWQLNDTFVVGLTANYDVTSKTKINGNAAGTASANWSESFDVRYDNGYDYGTDPGSCSTSGGCLNEVQNLNPSTTRSGSSISSSFDTGDSGAIGLRFGMLANQSTLLYLTGGIATIKVKQRSTYTSNASLDGTYSYENDNGNNTYNYSTSTSKSRNKVGYFIGAGMQSKLTDNISAKLEYRYYDYGTIRSTNSADANVSDSNNNLEFETDLIGTSSISQSTKIRQNVIRAVLSYDF